MLVMVVTLYSRDGKTHYRKVFVSIYLRRLSTFDGYIYLGSSAMNDDRLRDVRFLDFSSKDVIHSTTSIWLTVIVLSEFG